MRRNEIRQLHSKTIAELKADLDKAQKELVKLRLDLARKKIKNVRSYKEKRKDIARILTIIREKELKNA